ncbi:MAG TPA: YdaU family protein [Pseudoxanthomonas sp.]
MRHFAHNIGDYAAATAHLSFIEDAAYHRCLRRYYQDERALPGDVAQVQRLVGARTKEERQAVENVLAEFFHLEEDGYHQSRADREIETYHAKADAARANGTKGGRPANRKKTNPVISPVQLEKLTTPHSPLTNSEAKASGADAPQFDPVKALFDDGIKLLTNTGTSERQARSLIGGWRKAHGDEATRTAIQAAYDHGAVAPVEFIVASLTRAPKAHETWDQRRIREAMEAIQ